ncbi:hypothetical protein [Methylobacterium nigriterrae]|uniref:hypothetical protein n=1 Tax=Methylobacterium nigriterrae TaxID=3127512 RepID=UPI00301377F4
MPLPKTIKADAKYAVTVTRPVQLPDGTYILPSHDEILLSGEVLNAIKDQVADAVERA